MNYRGLLFDKGSGSGFGSGIFPDPDPGDPKIRVRNLDNKGIWKAYVKGGKGKGGLDYSR